MQGFQARWMVSEDHPKESSVVHDIIVAWRISLSQDTQLAKRVSAHSSVLDTM